MKKRIISALLCAAIAALSVTSFSALDTTDISPSGASSNYTVLSNVTIKDNYARFYKYGSVPESLTFTFLDINTDNLVYSQDFSFTSDYITRYLSSPSGYHYRADGGGNIYNVINFNNTGGTYEKIRFKLSDFSSYFNENGTYTKSFFNGEPHDYNFTDEGNGYFSSLVFVSGGAITAVAPDSNGMAEIYVSKNLGQETFFMTSFRCHTPTSSSSGGGTSRTTLSGFTIGDVDKDGYVRLADAILVQKSLLNMTTFDTLAKRNADANGDGKRNLLDAIKIQKYLLKMD